ncbi:MAG: type II secretion system F family protein [Syntrophotaleaceae bacterium]
MSLFEYSGFDAVGKKVSGLIEGPGKSAVIQKLRSQGIFPSSLREERESHGRRLSWRQLTWRKVPALQIAIATRQLAILLGAGLPLDEALRSLGEQLDHPVLARALNRARQDVIAGESFHQALENQHLFSKLFTSMVQVGENTGRLEQVLDRLADFLEEQARLRSKVQAALAYPLLMTLVGVFVLSFLFVYVIPKVTQMLDDLEQTLPLPTWLLIETTNFISAYWWQIVLVGAGLGYALFRFLRTDRGKELRDRAALNVPLFGKLNLYLATARFSRTLATLLHGGVPLLTALEIVRNLFRNGLLVEVLDTTLKSVREGEGLAAPLRQTALFPPIVAQMVAIGEKSGELEGVLHKVAESHEQQVGMTLTTMLSLLEPLMILVMGVVVGFVVIAILLPIFQASQGIG